MEPHTHPWTWWQGCPLGSRAGLSPPSHYVYNECWYRHPLKRREAAGLFPSYQFHLCGSFVLGGWVVWWGLGCLLLQGPFSPLGRYSLPLDSGNFLSPGKGTIVGVLGRGHWLKIGFHFATTFSTRGNDFSSPAWKGWNIGRGRPKPKPGEGIVRRALGYSRWVQVSLLEGMIPGDWQNIRMRLLTHWQWSWRVLENRNSTRGVERESVLQFFKNEEEDRICKVLSGELDFYAGLITKVPFFSSLNSLWILRRKNCDH